MGFTEDEHGFMLRCDCEDDLKSRVTLRVWSSEGLRLEQFH